VVHLLKIKNFTKGVNERKRAFTLRKLNNSIHNERINMNSKGGDFEA